ncbi:MAG TPA: DUF3830 family protein [Acidobacteriota bacterium]|jgi:hypothetical protein
MGQKRRRVRLSFPETGEQVVAEMLDDEAPQVCRYIWNLLPLEQSLIHGQYSGAEVFVLLDNPPDIPAENQAQIPVPGELFYFRDPGGNVTSQKNPTAEICVVYGRGVILRGPEGVPTFASLFARIPGDWKYDWVDFAKACRASRRQGPRRLRIERVED